MELQCELSEIRNEDLLKKMLQQSEDINRKREIRAQLFKLKENHYQSNIMSANNGKANFAPSHGQSLADQSFESIKSKEVRDSMDPAYDIKFQSLALNNPTTSGWNVQSTHEVSPDGRAYRSDTLATTGGVEKVNGGIAEYQGHNEQRSSASEVGDDKNFVKKSAESTKTHLQEKVVVGDEKNGRMEMKTSSTTSASSSQVFQSSSTFESGDEKFLKDNVDYNQRQKHFEHEKLRDLHQQQHDLRQQQDNYEQQLHKNYSNEFHSKHQETQQSQNIREQEVTEKTRRVVELDKSSPEYQQHVQYLMQQPGEIVSNTVEYPQPNVKMITTVKRLPDGTIVRNKRYETEATAEEAAQYRQTHANTTTTKQTTTKRGDTHDEVNQSTRNYQNRDDVDNARRQDFSNKKSDLQQYATNENVTKSFKTVKESTQRHVTKSSSQTVEEHNTAKSSDFSTHGFPSVRDDKPTQEFPTDHPQRLRSTTFPNTENFPKGSNVITTVGSDGVIKVSTQVQKTMKHKTNAEHIVETEIVGGDDDFTTLSHKPSSGFPTVSDHVYKQTSSSSQQHFSNTKNADKTSDFSSHGFPSVRDDKLTQEFPTDRPDRYTQQVNNETHSKNYERIIEHNVVPGKDSPIRKSTDFSTHGFPSVRSPTKTPNSFEYPAQTSSKVPQKSSPTQYKTTTTTRVTGKPPVATSAPTTKFIQKEKEVDAAHRAFAASLRSESPVDSIRREHYTDYQKQTPRSSISSNKTFRRDVREGSHDSGSSRFSSGTVTRQSPSKSVGKTVVTKHTTIKSRNVNGSNETIDLTSQHPTKSPSPTKGHTTTTTTKTIITTKTKADDVPKPDNPIQINKTAEHSTSINEPLTKTKSHFSTNATKFSDNLAIEEPCIKKNYYKLGQSDKIADELMAKQTTKLKPETDDIKELVSTMLETFKQPTSAEQTQKTTSNNKHKPINNTNHTQNSSVIEKSPHSPAQSSNNNRTHPQNKTPIRDSTKDNQNDVPSSEIRGQSSNKIVISKAVPINQIKTPTLERSTVERNINTNNDKYDNKSKKIKHQADEVINSQTIKKDVLVKSRKVDDTVFNTESNKKEGSPRKIMPTTKTKSPAHEVNNIFISVESNKSLKDDMVTKIIPNKDYTIEEDERKSYEMEYNIKINQSKPVKMSSPVPQSPNKSKQMEFPLNKKPSENSTSPLKTTEPKKPVRDELLKESEKTFETEKTTKLSRHSTPVKMSSPAPQSPNKSQPIEFPFKRQPSENSTRASSPLKTTEQKKPVGDESFEESETIFETEKTTKLSRHSTPVKMSSPAPQSPNKSKPIEFQLRRQPSETSIRASSPLKPTEPKKPVEDESFEESEKILETEKTTKLSRHSTPVKMSSPAPQSPNKSKPIEFPFKRQPSENSTRASSPLKSVIDKFEPQLKVEKSDTDGMRQTKVKKEDMIFEGIVNKQKHLTQKDFEMKRNVSLKNNEANTFEINEFIRNEQLSDHPEKPDGGLISKTKEPKEPETPSSPTYRKKGTGPRETFEDRCRKILGMEEDGATLGKYKNKKSVEELLENESVPSYFEVTIEDCYDDDDDEFKTVNRNQTDKMKTTESINIKESTTKVTQDKKNTKDSDLSTPNKNTPMKKETELAPIKSQSKNSVRQNKKDRDIEEVSIKHRLRSATKTTKDDIDSRSSPEISPDRLTERRRSSNISVHTEIIIDHEGPKSSSPEKELPNFTKEVKKTPVKKSPLTDRRDSGIVNRMSRKDKEKITSEETIQHSKSPKSDAQSLKPDRRPNKCFSTKTINLSTNEISNKQTVADQIVIDIQHAKSSREPSPDKIVPIPVPDHVDIGKPRYPDVVQEPEDHPKPKPVVTNIPILEEETNEYVGCQITEVSFDRMSEISDEILANPTVEAPQSLEYASINKPDDDCLLTVVEKVSKFTKVADESETAKSSKTFIREFDVSNKVEQDDECLLTVDQKVSKFLKTAEEVTKPLTPVRDMPKPNFENYNAELKYDDCTMSVSQKVEKFLNTSDKLKPTAPQKSPELVALMERQISTQSETPTNETTDSEEEGLLTEEEIEHKVVKKQLTEEIEIKEKQKTNGDDDGDDSEGVYPMSKGHTTAIELKRQKDILSRPSVFDKKKTTQPKTPSTPTTKQSPFSPLNKRTSLTKTENYEKNVDQKNIKNTLNIKITNKNETTQSNITHSPRTSVGTKPNVANLTEHNGTGKQVPISNEIPLESKKIKTTITNLPGGAKDSSDTIAARRSLFEKNTTQSPVHSPRRPSYMDHTKSSLEHTRRDSLEINKSSYARKVSTDEETQYERRPNSSVKFDVPERITKKKVQEDEDMNVEEIFDLELLEELLEKVTSYDLRRRIRAQIRIVKKMMLNSSSVETSHISSSTTYSSKKHHEETDAFNDVGYTGSLKVSGDHVKKETLHGDNVPKKPEDFTYKPRDRSHSPLGKTISSSLKEVRRDSDTNSSMSHHYKIESHMETSSSQYSNKESRKSRERSISPDMKKQSPQSKQSISPKRTSISSSQKSADRKNEFFSTKTLRSTQKSEEQLPIWTERKNILKSPSNDVKSKKISETRNTTIKTSTAERQRKPVEEDCIISSYGIGPTDENGLPLFGIRALKKKKLFQNDDIEQKVTGYVVEEKSYSENQGTPITERKEYVFSTDAGELNKLEKQMKSERMTSNKSMKSIQGRKESTQGEDDLMKSFKKIERRGSVKEMSEKFVRKESSQSITEKQNKYPKAGLILRTRSRSGSHDENIKSKIETKSIVTESESETETVKIRRDSNKKTSTKSTRSFLNAAEEERKVTGIDDVLERMRNADNITETGDSQEDQEARALLNKFFGASVIMSGVEAAMPMTQTKTTKKIVYSNNEGSPLEEVKTTQITTKTIKSNSTSSKPVAQTTCFIEGIEDELLLRDLLEKSTTYEERRKIRARLRELMAEREGDQNTKVPSSAQVEDAESSGSEYEEIIEEVTDYSEEEEEEEEEEEKEKSTTKVEKVPEKPLEKKPPIKEDKSKKTIETKDVKETSVKSEVDNKVEAATKSSGDKDSVTEKGESLMPLLQDLLHTNIRQAKTAQSQSQNNNSNLNKQIDNTNINTQNSNKMLSVRNQKMTNITNDPLPTTVTVTETAPTPTPTALTVGNNLGKIPIQVNRLSVPQKEDSGTESGEDLRLFAAGLRDKFDAQSDKNLIDDVISALTRLQCSLKEGTDISVDANKRKALLALVERLRTGLTSPEKLAELANVMADMEALELPPNESSSPESENQRSSRQRFAKRRNRNSRHTVGVSREELADARRYMEDMIMMENISNRTTPDSGLNTITSPQSSPEKHTSNSNLATTQAPLLRPNQFMSTSNLKTSSDTLNVDSKKTNRRPLSGDYSVSFVAPQVQNEIQKNSVENSNRSVQNNSPDSMLKTASVTAKRQLMKRANTIDIAKVKRFQSDQDTDSEMEDRGGPLWGLKRGVQVSVKKKVRNVIPPFEPKTENDHKFLAFINKQSPKPGLGWAGAKSVSNWTNKFGNIKNNFEVGIAATAIPGKPPQNPGHVHQNAAKSYWNKQANDVVDTRLQRSQEEAYERQRRLDLERLERQRLESERLERLRQDQERRRREQEQYQRECFEREQLERERYERQRLERERLQNERHEMERLEREQQELERLQVLAMNQQKMLREQETTRQPAPMNQFQHAPQSVFRPIENTGLHTPPIYKPIPQNPMQSIKKKTPSPQFLHAKHSISTPYLNSPSPTSTSPVVLPWLSKPSVDRSDFRNKANMFEERSQYDNVQPSYLQRHNSLRAPKMIQRQNELYRKRPSLPNSDGPYMPLGSQNQQNVPPTYKNYEAHNLPPPTNVSFIYDNFKTRNNYKSVPCLPLAVDANYARFREDSLTNPASVPLVLTNANPLYSPQTYPTNKYMPSKIGSEVSSPFNSGTASPAMMPPNDYTDDDLESVNMTEYRVEAKVMGRPQGQTAVTTTRRTNHMSDDEMYTKNSSAAKSLLNTMKNIGNAKTKKIESRPESLTSPKTCLSPEGRSYQAPIVEPIFPQVTNFETKRAPLIKQHTVPNAKKPQIESSYSQTEEYVSQSSMAKHRVNDFQRGYVVSYPSEESLDSLSQSSVAYRNPPPKSLGLNRQRNMSENSTTSSTVSYNNMPSPSTNWTANPIAEKSNINHTVEIETTETIMKKQSQEMPSIKPEIAPKPQNTANIKQDNQPMKKTKTQKEVKPIQIFNNVSEKLASKNYQQALEKKHSIDSSTNQAPNHFHSQKSLISSKHETQMRRKSLGNVIDVKESTSSDYIESKQTEYKSSAPPDTPDIVKSSLPKDESMPILKKFGPPQRHHYMPNSYQNPLSANKNTKNITKVTTNSVVRREQQQHLVVNSTPIIKETPSSPQPTEEYIPRNIVFNNISAFTSMSRRQDQERIVMDTQTQMPRMNRLSKSDSWNQIVQQQQQQSTPLSSSPKFNGSTNELRRTKSGHTLAVPKMFEAGIDKEQIDEKQKTVAAYFSGNKSPNSQLEEKCVTKSKYKSAINRTKTSEKVSASRKSLTTITTVSNGSGLSRSATMPHIANLNLLDESNVEDAFEQLMSEKPTAQTKTTEKTESKEKDGSVVTTTTKVTTRTVTKPESPFNKFRQLDKQNSLQSSKSTPTTPTTPGGGSSTASPSGSGVIFKFTDPALNARAATAKEQLLQWCQVKTQEYENIQITNFSSSWNDGLAFCALIHHFLPDAFDYSQLTAKNRRHNFQLAFNVADEKAGIAPLLDVDDMVMMKRPDWKCVFVYVQSIYRRFRNCQ